MILQWKSLHLIKVSTASRKIFRRGFDSCVVGMFAVISPLSDQAIVVGGGWAGIVASQHNLGERWTCGTCAQDFVLWWQIGPQQPTHEWCEQEHSAGEKHGGYLGFCIASNSGCVLCERNSARHPRFSAALHTTPV